MITPEQFKKDVMKLAEDVGVSPREIHIQTMKRKWASCSSKGRLTFDKSLLNEPGGRGKVQSDSTRATPFEISQSRKNVQLSTGYISTKKHQFK